jgi:two-component system, LytTR family, response regulator
MIRTLIVDDEPLARRKIREFLKEDREIEVVGECGTGSQAVSAVRSATPDLLFLDVQMPGMDGFAVLEELRDQRLPFVIFVTAYDKYAVKAF